MKKNLLAVLIASSIGLYGCGDEKGLTGNPTIDPIIEKSLKAETKIVFDLISDSSNPVIVMPTFLAMDSTDGTLSVEGSVGSDGYSTNLQDPQTAMGKTDGWSTTQPFVINFTGNDLDAASAADGFYLIESKNPTDSTDSAQPTSLSAADGDFMVMASGSTLTVVLLKPLKPASNYMFAITDDLKDVKGNSVGMTGSYAVLKATATPPSPALIPAQTIVHATEKELNTAGVNADSIIFSSWFTTHSVGDTLYATKAAIATGLALKDLGSVWKDDAKPKDLDLSLAYTIHTAPTSEDYATVLVNDTNFTKYLDDNSDTKKNQLITAYANAGTIKVTKGIVKLPHFLDQGANTWDSTPFQSAMPSLAKISNILATPESDDAKTIGQQLIGENIDVTKLATSPEEQLKLLGLTLFKTNGDQLDEERLLTKYSPVPQIRSLEDVPFLLFTPTTAPDSSLPVVIYQHGITSVKENAYAFAQNMAASGIAVIAIDNPLHGSRSLDDTRSANTDIKAYLNLGNLTVARDNIRQSMLDIMGLRASLTVSNKVGLLGANTELKKLAPNASETVSNTSFFGHSLGGVVGAPAVISANKTLGNDAGDALFEFKNAAYANSGGDIANLLIGSESYGSLIKHNLMLSSSKDYQTHFAVNCTDQSQSDWQNTCFDIFYAAVPEKAQQTMDATFNSFIYATQTIVGTADPINAVNLTNADGTSVIENQSVYMMQVAGDDTVPNSLPKAPMAGTGPMAKLFGLSSFTEAPSGTKHFARFSASVNGKHTTVIAPAQDDFSDLPAHTEAQSQLIQFMKTNGHIPSVTDGFLE